MIDPINITNYNRSDSELEELLLFCCAVAGKNALTTAKLLEKFLNNLRFVLRNFSSSPFELLKHKKEQELAFLLKKSGIGCYNQRARTFNRLSESNLDLKTCSVQDLEKIPGIGPKTSRFFILHTRKDVKLAVLDTHILRYMKDQGYDVPKSTPSGKRYREVELLFLEIANMSSKTLAQFDLFVWNEYRKKG